MNEIKDAVKTFILREFLPGENPDELTETTPLVSGGILDSLATLKLVSFLEERYKIVFQAHETDMEYLDTIEAIARIVAEKRS